MRTYSKNEVSKRVHVPELLLEDLRKLYALPPYNEPSNHAAHDGYFWSSIKRRFSTEQINQAKEILGIK